MHVRKNISVSRSFSPFVPSLDILSCFLITCELRFICIIEQSNDVCFYLFILLLQSNDATVAFSCYQILIFVIRKNLPKDVQKGILEAISSQALAQVLFHQLLNLKINLLVNMLLNQVLVNIFTIFYQWVNLITFSLIFFYLKDTFNVVGLTV